MRKQFFTILLMTIFSLFSFTSFSQGFVTGTVVDGETNEALVGASVVEQGTTNGTVTNANGIFELQLETGTQVIKITFIGYDSYKMKVNVVEGETLDVGEVSISPTNISLESVVIIGNGVIDLSEDRMTPIASTVITKVELQDKAVGNVEFPSIMRSSPNVYVTAEAGGYGDSKMFLRGFDQSNTAFLLNGQPINGMEDGNMYWSNWAGMSDISNAIDIQRGLGSSKLAISSVGGTVNIITKATDKKQGGFVRLLGGNGEFFKGTVAYNTGIMDNGWGVSFMLDSWQGDRKWADGTRGAGQNYFLSVGKEFEKHNLNFLIFGAPQWHDQNFSKSLELYDEYGLRYNDNWGYKDGEYTTWRRNYYHKPVMNLNWDWNINETSNLSTVLYASFGRGGGTGPYGSSRQYRIFDENRQIDFDEIVQTNNQLDGGIGTYGSAAAIRASVNNHQWYGAVTNYEITPNDNLTFNVGGDLRFYNGDHFRQLVDLMGLNGWEDSYGRYTSGDYIVSNTYKANPWASLFNHAPEEDRIAYDNSEWINYQGVFGQAEYANDNFSVFFQGALSNQSYKKEERFSADHEQSETLNRTGFNVKSGGSYIINENHTLFANVGHYSRQPFLDNIFEYGSIEKRSQEVENEEITGIELGYKAKLGTNTILNLNAYHTKWANRFLSTSAQEYVTLNGTIVDDAGIRMYNIAQIHKGLELEINTLLTQSWKLRGYATLGDWRYDGSTPVEIIDYNQGNQVVEKLNINLTGTHVGEAPQASLGLGTSYRANNFKAWLDLNHYLNLYGFVDVEDVALASLNDEQYEPEKLDPYSLVDLGASYDIKSIKIKGNVYNLFNTEYISRKDAYGYYYGNGTTFNLSVAYTF